MKAIVWTKYGPPDVLQLKEVEKPVPKDNELLIRIAATTVTAGDCELRGLKFSIILNFVMRLWRGLLKPRENTIPGTELAGEIEAVGKFVLAGLGIFDVAGAKRHLADGYCDFLNCFFRLVSKRSFLTNSLPLLV